MNKADKSAKTCYKRESLSSQQTTAVICGNSIIPLCCRVEAVLCSLIHNAASGLYSVKASADLTRSHANRPDTVISHDPQQSLYQQVRRPNRPFMGWRPHL